MIPVLDLFAGPGGLAEGFGSFPHSRNALFRIVLSIEKDPKARETLKLRGFFRRFSEGAPDAYYDFFRRTIELDELYRRYPEEAKRADKEVWLAVLGEPKEYPSSKIDDRTAEALDRAED
jgi:DNA (cytosine-5)-methyltransferase 1